MRVACCLRGRWAVRMEKSEGARPLPSLYMYRLFWGKMGHDFGWIWENVDLWVVLGVRSVKCGVRNDVNIKVWRERPAREPAGWGYEASQRRLFIVT